MLLLYEPAFLPPTNMAGNVSGCVCVSMCVCPVCALATESLDLETSFLVCRYIFRISRSYSCQDHWIKFKVTQAKISYKLFAKYTHLWVACLRLKGTLVNAEIFYSPVEPWMLSMLSSKLNHGPCDFAVDLSTHQIVVSWQYIHKQLCHSYSQNLLLLTSLFTLLLG